MNDYQVVLEDSSIIKIKADSAFTNGMNILCFHTNPPTGGDPVMVAQFMRWVAWNVLAPAEVPQRAKRDQTAVVDLPTGRDPGMDYVQATIDHLSGKI